MKGCQSGRPSFRFKRRQSNIALDGTIVLDQWTEPSLEGDLDGILGTMLNQTDIPGLVTTPTSLQRDERWIFAGISPGRFMNIAPMDPHSHDSDLDVMPMVGSLAIGWIQQTHSMAQG